MYPRYILQALEAAKYHEDLTFSFENLKKGKITKSMFHLRAYFWELWSVWEYILQHANIETLKLPSKEVRRDFIEQLKQKFPKYKFLKVLEKIQNEEYFKRIKLIRDHAHNWQIAPYGVPIMVIHDDSKVVRAMKLNNIDKDKELPMDIYIERNDLGFMEHVVKTLSEKGFFKDSEVVFNITSVWRK